MNDPTKTKQLLFNEQKILSPAAIAILNEYKGFERGRIFNAHGTIIIYNSDDIPGYVFRRMKELLGDENELLRYIFPDFINTAHYLQNRDANVARSSVPEPGQYLVPSPYVTPYLINATWQPYPMPPAASIDMDVVPSSDIPPTIDLCSPRYSEDYSNIETTSHARSAPSSPYASARRNRTNIPLPGLRTPTTRYSPYSFQFRSHSRDSPSREFYGSQTFEDSQRQRSTSAATSQSPYSGVSPSRRFTHHSPRGASNYSRGRGARSSPQLQFYGSPTFEDSQRQRSTNTASSQSTYSGGSPSRRFTYHSPRGASNYSQDLRGAGISSIAPSSDMFRSTRPQRTYSNSRWSPYHTPARQRDHREDGNDRHSSRYNPRR